MSIFDLRQFVIDEYSKYVQSFLSIADERVRASIEELLLRNQALWPDALLQLNPSYEMASTIKFYFLSPLGERGSACLWYTGVREIPQISRNIHNFEL